MKIVLESALDFKQFQNLIILIFCCLMILLGMFNSLKLEEYIFIKISLIFFTVVLLNILFMKKGLYLEQNKLYTSIFLFGIALKNTNVSIELYNRFYLIEGKHSTNYAYSKDVKSLHNWEPDLNVSIKCFSLIMDNENSTSRKKILTITKFEKANIAVNFIAANTNLKFS